MPSKHRVGSLNLPRATNIIFGVSSCSIDSLPRCAERSPSLLVDPRFGFRQRLGMSWIWRSVFACLASGSPRSLAFSFSPIAQLVVRRTVNPDGPGSIPGRGATPFSRVAQLAERGLDKAEVAG